MIAPLALALALLAPPDATPPGAASPDAPICAPQESGACDPAVRAKTLALLGAMDRPVRPETWRALGPGAEPVLAEVAASDGLPSRRALALEGLAALGGARAEALHRSVARDEHEPRAVRRAAVRGLGRLVPAERLDATLRPLLERDPDRAVRAGAAEVLSRRSPAASCAAIRAQARREGSSGRSLFSRALAACER
ncbi:HEAT repeat domain-containing protein [Anaeromyxobacter sp. Fw109-5]|uniref:HEAT repeat domain-containing protein n=1 Tax=Anaeromyxobacter sp. (strain Fw109-5) TaxID=404589 RepID=UPI000158A84B|nr:HEAT repeat domain-containing protein [Anaeromyxobacter sp. Fw109-5]ABS28450.1 conserved hypothetical protein [Anaeromyxobacter sp. Fw109-5]